LKLINWRQILNLAPKAPARAARNFASIWVSAEGAHPNASAYGWGGLGGALKRPPAGVQGAEPPGNFEILT